MSELEQKVIEIIKSKCMEVNDQTIVTKDSNLDSLDIDSFEYYEILIAIEDYFEIRISDFELGDIDTFGDLIRIIKSKI